VLPARGALFLSTRKEILMPTKSAHLWRNDEYLGTFLVSRYGPKNITGSYTGDPKLRTFKTDDGYQLVWGEEDQKRKLEVVRQRARTRPLKASAANTHALLERHVVPSSGFYGLRNPSLPNIHKLSDTKLEELQTALRWANTILSSLDLEEKKGQ
jgi:hypothetical protein